MALVLLVAAGCGVPDVGPFGGDPVREEWESHSGVADCGSTQVRQGEELAPSAAARSCFEDARARGDEARLSLSYPTTEGDPIHDHYLLTGDGRVRLYEDATEDAFGPDEWMLVECFEPDWLPDARCG